MPIPYPNGKSGISPRSPPSWLAATGFALAVTAMWRPGILVSVAPGHRLALGLPDWVLVVVAVAAFAMFLAIVSVLIPSPRRKDPDDFELEPPPPPRVSPAMLIALFLLLAAMVTGTVILLHLLDAGLFNTPYPGSGHREPQAGASPPIQVQGPERDVMTAPAIDLGLTLLLGAVAAVIITFALLVIAVNPPWATIADWVRFRRRRRRLALAEDLSSAMSAGILELGIGDDPRSAIIACYRRCEATLASRRRRRYASETPREFVQEALAALQLPVQAVRALLSVFERARFSDLPVTQSDRAVALDALGEIRSALERRSEDGSRA